MKKMLLSMAVTAALTGCGGDEGLTEANPQAEVLVPSSTVIFDPANGVLSAPHDLLFNGTTDGTLNLPGEMAAGEDYSDPQMVLGAIDGWSSQTPYKIDLQFAPGVSLDASSVAMPGSVRIFQVEMGASIRDAECSVVTPGLACKGVAELQYGVDFVAQASGDAVAIIPLKPFMQGASYMNVLTTQLQDSEGRSIKPSSTYALVKQDIEKTPLVTPSQLALQGIVNSYENAVVSVGGISKDEIIYAAPMTIQSAGDIVNTGKKLLAASLDPSTGLNSPQIQLMNTGISVGAVFAASGMTDVNPVFNEIEYHKGTINLTRYLRTPTSGELEGLNETYMKAMCDSGAALKGFVAAGGTLPEQPVSELDGACMALSEGSLRALTGVEGFPVLDPNKHLTKFNPIPMAQGVDSVPVQYTQPVENSAVLSGVRQMMGMGPLVKPENGWPLVILQHGITSKKEDMLALTAALSLQGYATIAIDHPLHGERGIDLDDDGTDEFNATTSSVLHYMNLKALLAARDNLRQSVLDILGLRFGINSLAPNPMYDVDTSNVSFIGHSLGALVAPSFLATANETLGSPQADALFNVKAAALGSGGSGVASFLFESGEFGPFIKASILVEAGTAESVEFGAFITDTSANGQCLASFGTNQEALLTCSYGAFIESLALAGESSKLANIEGVFTQFIFAAQSALDASDASNYTMRVKNTETPVYMSVVVGDGADNKPDTVIPPMVATNPIAGSLPMANMMGLTAVSSSQMSETPASYLVNFTKGHHGTLLTPAGRDSAGATAEDSAKANTEMQTQVASFIASGGMMLKVTDTSVIAETEQ